MLRTILTILQVLSAFGIVALVLLQRGKGADAGAGFGAGASGTVFGARGATHRPVAHDGDIRRDFHDQQSLPHVSGSSATPGAAADVAARQGAGEQPTAPGAACRTAPAQLTRCGARAPAEPARSRLREPQAALSKHGRFFEIADVVELVDTLA